MILADSPSFGRDKKTRRRGGFDKVYEVFWLNVFGPKLVEAVGRDRRRVDEASGAGGGDGLEDDFEIVDAPASSITETTFDPEAGKELADAEW